jgi:hypothetical protein
MPRSTSSPIRRAAGAALLALAVLPPALALETKVSGRITFGAVYRTEASDPLLLSAVNAAAIGLVGTGSGSNADDANTNYRRGDAASRALKAYVDLSAREGNFSALLRVKAWHDYGLLNDERPWGNSANGYAAGAPLLDAGAPRLSRFSGVALGDAWLQHSVELGGMRLLGRIGQQSLDWGTRSGIPGGLEALNPKDLSALHRAGAVPQEIRVPVPMLFGRLELNRALALEGYYQGAFRPTALDMCGTLWANSDYFTEGCDKIMSGPPQVSDRQRVALGAYQKRLPTPRPEASEFGLGLTWKSALLATDFGLYHARYTSRTAMPALRRSSRAGPALIPGDPDGKNMAYFTEYEEGLRITVVTFAHKRGGTGVFGELSYRPRLPFMLAPGDVVPPFLNPAAPSLLRADVDATPLGGVFHGSETFAVTQAQLGVQHDWVARGVPLSASAEVVAKRTAGLPDQALRRYGRTEILGVGAIHGFCPPSSDIARSCSLRGYATANAYAYRLRFDARFAELLPQLNGTLSAVFAHDVKGWSGDFLVNEGRRTLNLGLRLEYRQRYLAELGYMPNWGGDYNPAPDRDTVAVAVGVKF